MLINWDVASLILKRVRFQPIRVQDWVLIKYISESTISSLSIRICPFYNKNAKVTSFIQIFVKSLKIACPNLSIVSPWFFERRVRFHLSSKYISASCTVIRVQTHGHIPATKGKATLEDYSYGSLEQSNTRRLFIWLIRAKQH